jgi:transposase
LGYRPHTAPQYLLYGYDPVRDLAPDHLARLVERVVEDANLPRQLSGGKGQPAFDPRLCAKVLVYGYATRIRSSRQLERMCNECLPYLFLTRGDTPSYRTLCSFRVHHSDVIERIFLELYAVAGECGMQRLGAIVIDSSKFRADAGPEAVVTQTEFQPVLDELKQILQEAREADDRDDQDPPGQTNTGQPVDSEQMRDILRRVRTRISRARKCDDAEPASEADTDPKKPLGPRMRPRIKAAVSAIEAAKKDESKFVCLTDPDAQMMAEGREKHIHECHSFEVVVDKQDGLLVAGQTCQSPTDNSRLLPLVETAEANEPDGVNSADADSGYYSGDAVASLISKKIDTCIPDSNTAGDLHHGRPIGTTRSKIQGSVRLDYDAQADCYRCPEGNTLSASQHRQDYGQMVTVYRADQPCTDCPQAPDCLTQPKAKHRTIKRGDHADILEEARQRFCEPEHLDRYHHRGKVVETVFGFIRSTLGYTRWSLRGKDRVASEGTLFKTAYQLRKVHLRWAQQAA